MSTSTAPAAHLKATYANFHSTSTSDSPLATQPFEISTPLEPLSTPNGTITTEQKTAYLRSLRAAVSDLQSRVNSELTGRMEDEASRLSSGTTAGKKGSKGVDEVAEEENYGEEVVEDDE
ncbi:hypothetical protein F4821DRAFT_81481 [Hypoxylon rubiginosum]|uniref:Uncharacterized protein n=1 Tax=Hypoxylon rubiginosum TaxID=110542 RepID=A0ACC0D843_9PEZI|nr:hypothetical protein F4821DRAFT_81481 [Hypoxylon rubiginosum]